MRLHGASALWNELELHDPPRLVNFTTTVRINGFRPSSPRVMETRGKRDCELEVNLRRLRRYRLHLALRMGRGINHANM